MKRLHIAVLCLGVLLALSATVVSDASAKRVWLVKGAVLPTTEVRHLVANIKTGQEALLISKISTVETHITCKKASITTGEIFNETPAKKTSSVGRDNGTIKLEECALASGVACSLTATAAKEINLPPTVLGHSTLVENTLKTEIYDDFMPEGAAPGEMERYFADIGLVGTNCPPEDIVESTATAIGFPFLNASSEAVANEGEGGLIAEILPGTTKSKVQTFKFTCNPIQKALNWVGKEIKVGEFADVVEKRNEEGQAKFCGWNPTTKATVPLEIEMQLTTGEEWSVK